VAAKTGGPTLIETELVHDARSVEAPTDVVTPEKRKMALVVSNATVATIPTTVETFRLFVTADDIDTPSHE
jgi:hypothetical protein